MAEVRNCGGHTITLIITWIVIDCTKEPVVASDKSFEQFMFCAVMAADRTVSLDQTSSCTLNGGIPDDVLCAWMCNREPQCMHFNYRKDNQTCDMFYTDQTCFVMDANCVFFQVDIFSLVGYKVTWFKSIYVTIKLIFMT